MRLEQSACQMPLVSVVTPTKNRCGLLREAMDSLAAQTLASWEHIVVDDGSNDGTAEELALRAAVDPRVRYVPRTGRIAGASVCRNQGWMAARADLIVFLDSDDVLTPECLARRVATMQRNGDLDFIVSRMGAFQKIPGDLGWEQAPDTIGDDLLAFLFFELPWQTSGPTWRRQVLERLSGFDETLPSWQDIDLHLRAITAGSRYLRCPHIDYYMRWQVDPDKLSTLQHRSPDHLRSAEALLAKFERLVREGPGMTWVRQRALCSLYFLLAEQWVEIGGRSEALMCWALIRSRKLGSPLLYGPGVAILVLQALGRPGHRLGRRIGHKWKGWARLRTNPELVPA